MNIRIVNNSLVSRHFPTDDTIAMFHDIVLTTEDGGHFSTSRLVLSGVSQFFRTLFGHERNIAGRSSVFVPEISSKVMELILEYTRSSIVHVDDSNFEEMILAADFLLIPEVKEACLRHAERNLSVENCILYYSVYHLFDYSDHKYATKRFIQMNFEKVIKETERGLADLPGDFLLDLLQLETLNVSDESVIREGVCQWLKGNSDRAEISRDEENDETETSQRIFSKLLDLDSNSLPQCLPMEISFLVYCPDSGTEGMLGECVILEFYDNQLDYSRKIGSYENYNCHACVISGQKIYVFDYWKTYGIVFDVIDRNWSSIVSPCLCNYTIMELQGCLYAMDDTKRHFTTMKTMTFQKYDSARNCWKEVSCSPNIQNHTDAVTLGGFLFVAGHVAFSPEIVFEFYDPLEDTWTILNSPSLQSYQFLMRTFKDQVYIFGGKLKDGYYVTEVERYDPSSREWSKLKELPCNFIYIEVKVLNSKLVAFITTAKRVPSSRDHTYAEIYICSEKNNVQGSSIYWDEESFTWNEMTTDTSVQDANLHQACYHEFKLIDKEVIKNIRTQRPFYTNYITIVPK